ncbi:MAG: hypothetical protein JNM41_09460 [Flavipsychrobacter sp.]|nr:hypothetical protein [Flavipsychrobacter sp.]
MNRLILMLIVALTTSCTNRNTFLTYKMGCSKAEYEATTEKLLREGELVDMFEPGCHKTPTPAFQFTLPIGRKCLGLLDSWYIDDKLVTIDITLYKRPYCRLNVPYDAELLECALSVADLYVQKYGKPDSIINQMPTQISSKDLHQTQQYKWVRDNIIIGVNITPWENEQAFCRVYYEYNYKTREKLYNDQQNRQKDKL